MLQILHVSFFSIGCDTDSEEYYVLSMIDADNNVSEPITQPDNTIRVDPLDNFKKYRGGFNITNKHYWSVSKSFSLFVSESNF